MIETESGSRVYNVTVVGSGYMGGGMAQVFAAHGFNCTLVDASNDLAEASVKRLIDEASRFESDGLMPPGSAERISQNLNAAENLPAGVRGADYIAEAVPEVLEIKLRILAEISEACDANAVIGTNTSAIPIDQLSAAVRNPSRFLGVHWMNPAPFVPGVEVILGRETVPSTVAFVRGLLTSIDKAYCAAPASAGFIANRLQVALFAEACRMVEEGLATIEEIDKAVSNSFGFRLPFFGPFRIADMAGLDVYVGMFHSLSAAFGERFGVPEVLTNLVDEGKLGVKTGEGFTQYDPEDTERLVRARDRAYCALSDTKRRLGWR